MPKSETIENKIIRSLFKKAAKTEFIVFRLSRQDKISIRKAAKSVNVSMTDYLTNLHRFAITPASQAKPTVIEAAGAK